MSPRDLLTRRRTIMSIHPVGFRWEIHYPGHKQHRNNREYSQQALNVFRHQELSARNQQRGMRSPFLANPNRVNPWRCSNENDYQFVPAPFVLSADIQRFTTKIRALTMGENR